MLLQPLARQATRVFLAVFVFTLSVGLIVQLIVLPMLPGLHAGDGLLKGGDWVQFHRAATELAQRMRDQGWAVWNLRAGGNAPIGVAAAMYYITGISQPWVVLPINAILFAFSALCIFRIFRNFGEGRIALVATLPFVLYPSAIMIYGQMHKDVYSIAGTVAIVLVWVQLSRRETATWVPALGRFALLVVGCFLVWLVRPYLLDVLLGISILAMLFLLAVDFQSRRFTWWAHAVVCVFATYTFHHVPTLPAISDNNVDLGAIVLTEQPIMPSSSARDETSPTNRIDAIVSRLDAIRTGFATGYPDAGSNVDTDVRYETASDIVLYLPRAVSLALFAPFPTMWHSTGKSPGGTLMRTISGFEMMISYLLVPGVALLIFLSHAQRPAAAVATCMALMMITFLALVVCNVGTLYRMRYGSWQILNGLGVIGWTTLWHLRRLRVIPS